MAGEVLPSAHKWGYTDDDIEHALRFAIVAHEMDGYVLVVGPTPAGELIEVGVNRRAQRFHAMRARPKYLPSKTKW